MDALQLWKCIGCETDQKEVKHMIAVDDERMKGVCSDCITQMVSLIALKERKNRPTNGKPNHLRLL
jgi:hypothetical protein